MSVLSKVVAITATAAAVAGGLQLAANAAEPPAPAATSTPATPPGPSEDELCAGMIRVVLPGLDQCTRGPHLVPGAQRRTAVQPLSADAARKTVAANPIVCEGDGVSGKRVEVLYARETQQASRLSLFLPTFRAWSHEIDAAYNDSAVLDRASRHVRFVTEATAGGCQIQVREVVVATGGLASWEAMITALQAQNFKSPSRKYLVYADAQATCGLGTIYNDDRPGSANANNTSTGYARVDAPCWGFNAAAHELGHNFGAVQSSAPNYNGHCNDEWDLMCYGDDTRVVCADKDYDRLLDCRNDDYFSAAPPPGSYLATHWNIANSDWLIKSTVPDSREGPRHGQVYELVNPATGNVLGVEGGSTADLAYLNTQARTGATGQQWRFRYETGWQLQNVASEKCADTAYSETAPGTEALQYTCNGQDGMRWNPYTLGDGTFGILNTLSGLALTAGATNARVTQQPFTASAQQRWELRPVPLADGVYRIRAEVGNYDLDVVDCATQNRADLRMWYRITTSPCQRWKVTSVGNGAYSIVDSNSGKAVEVTNCTTQDATPVQLWEYYGGTCQQWRISRSSDNAFKVIGVGSGKSLDVGACSPKVGADVLIWPFHGRNCQRWYFDPV